MFTRRGRILPSTRRALFVLPLWLASSLWLWTWWFSAAQSAQLWLYVPLTLALLFEYVLMPGVLLYSVLSAGLPKKRRLYESKKVAIITPCVPSQESITVIKRQLKAMSEVDYPHDSWILDEGGSKVIKKLAKQYGVKYFTRKNIKKYNQPDYPFKSKTKAGNINAWLERVKKQDYEFFVQMDIDHLPTPDYLDKALGHFRDKKVAWVQAPSVYGNLDSWTARASAEQELGFHGPLQMSLYKNADAPVIVGSHTTFRMKAIQQIGGFQPTRAEDHLNTLALMEKGWNGVYMPEIIAKGDGPETFTAFLSQQYAWAFSMTQILKTFGRKHMKNLSKKRQLQFLFLQSWYPLWSLTYFVLFAVPVLGLLSNTHAMDAHSGDFIYRFMPVFVASLLLFWASLPLSQPQGLSLSWRGIILHVVRWPVILNAVVSSVLGHTKPYQVTPKGKFLREVPTVKLYRPFLALGLLSACAMLFGIFKYHKDASDGLLVFASMNMFALLGICVFDLSTRLKQARLDAQKFVFYWLKPVAMVASVALFSLSTLAIAVSHSELTALAFGKNTLNVVGVDLSSVEPSQLNDSQLRQELGSQKYAPPASYEMPTVGMYNPQGQAQTKRPYIQHGFYDWREDRKMSEDVLTTIRNNNIPFVTIEPKGEQDGAKLLNDIASGKYDERLNKTLVSLGSVKRPVYVRFAHEMDLADLYPWGSQDCQTYINAYRHVHDLAQKNGASNIRWVWGPGGTAGAACYYPGDDVVDVIGSTVLTDKYWTGNSQFSFHDLVYNRLWLQQYGKPVWVTEFGAGSFNPSYQNKLVRDAVANYKQYGFSALIYLNAKDSNIDGPNYLFSSTKDLSDALGLND